MRVVSVKCVSYCEMWGWERVSCVLVGGIEVSVGSLREGQSLESLSK